MRIRILSDLHLEKAPFTPADADCDVLVLAGDIQDGKSTAGLESIIRWHSNRGIQVLYIPGNHEFYTKRIASQPLALRRLCQRTGARMLHNAVALIGGVRYYGTTLWTDFDLDRSIPGDLAMNIAKNALSDFTWIFTENGACLTPLETLSFHQKAVRLMRIRLESPFDEPTVVVTHHAPHPRSIAQRFQGHQANAAFVSNLKSLMLDLNPVLWIHGHVHDSFDYYVGDVRVIANPRGYASKLTEKSENRLFDPSLTIEVASR